MTNRTENVAARQLQSSDNVLNIASSSVRSISLVQPVNRIARQTIFKTYDSLYWNITPPKIGNKLWNETLLDFSRLNYAENSVFFDKDGHNIDVKPFTEQETALDFVMERYVRFCRIAKELDECYRFLAHPQKRELMRACLKGVIVRILELKNDLVQIDQREYHFFENMLQELNCTHDEIELGIPAFIQEERAQVLKNREKILTNLYEKTEAMNLATRLSVREMNKKEAILLIQRQTRFYLGNIKMMNACRVLRPISPDRILTIQKKVIKKWSTQSSIRETYDQKINLDLFLDIIPDNTAPPLAAVHPVQILTEKNAMKLDEDYQMDKAAVENHVFDSEGPGLAWSLKYTIMQWLIEVRDALGKFPPFPEAEDGGSALLFTKRSIADVADELNTNVTPGKINYLKLEKPKVKKKPKKIPKKSPWLADNGFEYRIEETDCMRDLKECVREYRDIWYFKDESDNIYQKHDPNVLVDWMRPVVAEEIRNQVDELIRTELENIRYAIDKEPRKGNAPVKSKKKKSSERSTRKGIFDPTADSTIEELFGELVRLGIIVLSPRVKLNEFLGENRLSGAAMDKAKADPYPAVGDIRRLITEFAILPLCSNAIHENAPLIRKLLIAGMRETGKKFLLHAICHEVGAILFDLTPSNLEGKFDDPQGKKMLMHLIIKVGKAMEPSVFWIGNCEKMFLKKKDKTDTSKPHQWVSALHRALQKGVKNGDRMMLIGTTSQPYLTKQKKFNKFYDRIVIVPQPDYPSRYTAWKHFIGQALDEPLPPYFDLSTLTKVTDGYSIGTIKETCELVLTRERIAQFTFIPMQPSDFINEIWRKDPIYREEQELFADWYSGTPLAKERLARVHDDEE